MCAEQSSAKSAGESPACENARKGRSSESHVSGGDARGGAGRSDCAGHNAKPEKGSSVKAVEPRESGLSVVAELVWQT
jgi:hypothetical protein